LIFAVLIVQFNSFRDSFIVLSVVPLSLIGVLLGLLVTREYLSFPSMLGFIALAGIVVNNAIILVDVWNRMREDNPEMSLRTIVIEGAALRLRPILLTTITTIVGIAPLIFASDLWRPIAVSIMFGLLFAVVLTLLMVPVLYLRFRKYARPEGPERGAVIELPPSTPKPLLTAETPHKEDGHDIHTLVQRVLALSFVLVLLVPTSFAEAFMYTPDNVQTSYQEAPSTFSVGADGTTVGATVSGIPFRQLNVANAYGIHLQRFEIGTVCWYISDRGIIWTDSDLVALSIYLSRA
jgi:predicted RND superfamily exporter protein